MKNATADVGVIKTRTGIPGFEFIADGGLPRGRTPLVAGSAGSAKTVFANQFQNPPRVRHEPFRIASAFGEMGVTTVLTAERPDQYGAMSGDDIALQRDNKGMHIGKPFSNVAGVLAGNPVQIGIAEMERLDQLFPTVGARPMDI